IVISPLLLKHSILRYPGAQLPIVCDGRDHDKMSGNSELRTLAGQKRPTRVLTTPIQQEREGVKFVRIEILSEFAPSVVEDEAPGVVAVNLGSSPCNGGP